MGKSSSVKVCYTYHMQLLLPSIHYKDSFLEAVSEYKPTETEDRLEVSAQRVENIEKNFEAYLATLRAEVKGANLPAGFVPQTTFWLVDGNTFIGRISIRHQLNEQLRKVGGHIGYAIRPSKRQMGYGKKILELALPKAKELGITKALVTCNETNIGSRKIIEANGGVLEDITNMGEGNPRKLRYWIHL